jgi:hypothetical protein
MNVSSELVISPLTVGVDPRRLLVARGKPRDLTGQNDPIQ